MNLKMYVSHSSRGKAWPNLQSGHGLGRQKDRDQANLWASSPRQCSKKLIYIHIYIHILHVIHSLKQSFICLHLIPYGHTSQLRTTRGWLGVQQLGT